MEKARSALTMALVRLMSCEEANTAKQPDDNELIRLLVEEEYEIGCGNPPDAAVPIRKALYLLASERVGPLFVSSAEEELRRTEQEPVNGWGETNRVRIARAQSALDRALRAYGDPNLIVRELVQLAYVHARPAKEPGNPAEGSLDDLRAVAVDSPWFTAPGPVSRDDQRAAVYAALGKHLPSDRL